MSLPNCSVQTYWYESGVQVAKWCDQTATHQVEGIDGVMRFNCTPHMEEVKALGANNIQSLATEEEVDDLIATINSTLPWKLRTDICMRKLHDMGFLTPEFAAKVRQALDSAPNPSPPKPLEGTRKSHSSYHRGADRGMFGGDY